MKDVIITVVGALVFAAVLLAGPALILLIGLMVGHG